MARPRRTDRLGEDHAAKPHTTSKRSDWQLKQLAVYTLTTGARLVGLAVTPPCIMSPPTCLAATYTQPRNGWTWPVDRRPLDLCRPEVRIKRLHRAPRVIISNENSFFFLQRNSLQSQYCFGCHVQTILWWLTETGIHLFDIQSECWQHRH